MTKTPRRDRRPTAVELAKRLHRNFLKKNQDAPSKDWTEFYDQAVSFLKIANDKDS